MKHALTRTTVLAALLALLVTACTPGGVGSQAPPGGTATAAPTAINIPERGITRISPCAGGNAESQSRLVAPMFQAKLPKPVKVIVENVAGGAGLIGYPEAVDAPPDGYTLSIDDPVGNAIRSLDQTGEAKFN